MADSMIAGVLGCDEPDELTALHHPIQMATEIPSASAIGDDVSSPQSTTFNATESSFNLAGQQEIQNNGLRSSPGRPMFALAEADEMFQPSEPEGSIFAFNDNIFDFPDVDSLTAVPISSEEGNTQIPSQNEPATPRRNQVSLNNRDSTGLLHEQSQLVTAVQPSEPTSAVETSSSLLHSGLPTLSSQTALENYPMASMPMGSSFRSSDVSTMPSNHSGLQNMGAHAVPKLAASVVLHALTKALGLPESQDGETSTPPAIHRTFVPQEELTPPPPAGSAKDARARRTALLQYRRSMKPTRTASNRRSTTRRDTGTDSNGGSSLKKRLTDEEVEEKRIKNRASVQACRQRKRARKSELEAERAHYSTEHAALRDCLRELPNIANLGVHLSQNTTNLLVAARNDLFVEDEIKNA